MRQGICTLESIKKRFKQIGTCEYHGKEYILYKDDYDTMILVDITDGWYLYIFAWYTLTHSHDEYQLYALRM